MSRCNFLLIAISTSGVQSTGMRISLFCILLAGVLIQCRSSGVGSARSFTECPVYYRNVAFPSQNQTTRPVSSQAEIEIEPDYLDQFYEDIQEDFEDSGFPLKKNGDGFEARGITLRKIPGNDGYTRELIVTLDGDLTFDPGSAKLDPKAQELIGKIGQGLRKYPNTLLRIGGHSDSPGSFQANKLLSRRRAESVWTELLTRHRIPPKRIQEVEGFADARKIEATRGPFREKTAGSRLRSNPAGSAPITGNVRRGYSRTAGYEKDERILNFYWIFP